MHGCCGAYVRFCTNRIARFVRLKLGRLRSLKRRLMNCIIFCFMRNPWCLFELIRCALECRIHGHQAGMVSGAVTSVLLQPLDVIKTRVQLDNT